MTYDDIVGPIIFILILVIGVGWLRIHDEFLRKPNKYCTICGCPTKPLWLTEYTRFDPKTGQGVTEQREYWYCGNTKGGLNNHYRFKSRHTRELIVPSKCDE